MSAIDFDPKFPDLFAAGHMLRWQGLPLFPQCDLCGWEVGQEGALGRRKCETERQAAGGITEGAEGGREEGLRGPSLAWRV